MNLQARSFEQAANVSSRELLIQLNFVVCTLSYWAIIIAPYFYFKTFYIATAVAVFITALLALMGVLRADGILKAAAPIIFYFLYLFLTSAWALYPRSALISALIDSIFLFVFGLFYVIGLNDPLKRIANIFILSGIPSVLNEFFFYEVSLHKFQRIGYGAIYYILPYALPFCLWKIKITKGRKGIPSFLLILAFILVSKSRTPILIALITVPLTIIYLSERFRASLVFFLKIGVALIICLVILLSFEQTRSFMQESLDRFTGQQEERLGEVVSEDWLRVLHYKEGLRLLIGVQPLGMGYNNFNDWMEQSLGIALPMHNTFMAWVLEGGIPLLIIGCYLLYRFFSILRTMITTSDNEQEKDFYKVVLISMIGVILHGLTHHAHKNPAFFILLGIAYSLPRRLSRYPKAR